MAGRQRIDRVRRQYNQWVANQTLEDYALRFTAKSARRWSAARVANTALGAISFLALEAIGGTITLNYGASNATAARPPATSTQASTMAREARSSAAPIAMPVHAPARNSTRVFVSTRMPRFSTCARTAPPRKAATCRRTALTVASGGGVGQGAKIVGLPYTRPPTPGKIPMKSMLIPDGTKIAL